MTHYFVFSYSLANIKWSEEHREEKKKKSQKKECRVIKNTLLLNCMLLKDSYSILCFMTIATKYFLCTGMSTENTELNFLKAKTS